jgi:molybdenum cofactor biosynthesis enzyme MoaA
MTTNGILLSRKLGALVDAGLSSVNISLDTLGAAHAGTPTWRAVTLARAPRAG